MKRKSVIFVFLLSHQVHSLPTPNKNVNTDNEVLIKGILQYLTTIANIPVDTKLQLLNTPALRISPELRNSANLPKSNFLPSVNTLPILNNLPKLPNLPPRNENFGDDRSVLVLKAKTLLAQLKSSA